MEPFGKTDYETDARKALQKGEVDKAQVYATLHQAQVLKAGLEAVKNKIDSFKEMLEHYVSKQ
ncbi:hypothetical protein [Nonomuraea wenchangensis]|uniref:Uncharacterized protein n=1 Tax=Nonomuraea wenchangensis TaxID=568860 RepID=A0A1I0HEG5_9ACTN|nr:hypothetical protein [Nonomuraea wenchangensis]SET82245.1 hypothetical protein SAMN05421811_104270 [Nonomuraea wenchangensis]